MQKILLTSARSPITLDLARQFTASGHEVYVADTTKFNPSRFSKAVKKAYSIPSPRFYPDAFVDSLVEIIKEQNITLLIPIYEEVLLLAKERYRFPKSCRVFAESFNLLRQLHNKWFFHQKLLELGIESPNTILIETQEDLNKLEFAKQYALKASYSRGSLSLKKAVGGKPMPKLNIEEHNPWIAQEWLEGKKYCSYTICNKGVIQSHAAYPVQFAIDGNSCITFEAIEHQPIFRWVENLVGKIEFSGQIAFDFIEKPDKTLFALECNPRATSGVHLFKPSDRLDLAFFGETNQAISPQKGNSKQLFPGMLLYGWKKSSFPNNNFRKFLKALASIEDVVFKWKDPMPFLAFPFILASIWADSKKHKISIPAAFTFDFEWNGEKPDV